MARNWNIETLESREVPSTTVADEVRIDVFEEVAEETVQTVGEETEEIVELTSVPEAEEVLPPVEFGEGNFEALSVGSKYLLVSGLKTGESYLYGFNASGELVDTGKSYTPFPGNERRLSPVRGAVGDVNGDGRADLAFVSGGGMAAVLRVIDGATGKDLVTTRTVFGDRFLGGANVAMTDLDADGKEELVITPDAGGGPRVRIFSLVDGKLVTRADFFSMDDTSFRGGLKAAAGDFNGDGATDLAVAAGVGGAAKLAIFDGAQLAEGKTVKMIADFATMADHQNGVAISAGDLNNDGYADLVVGGGAGSTPEVLALDGKLVLTDSAAARETPLARFFAFDSRQRVGVRVAVKDIDGDGKADLVAGTGEAALTRLKTYKTASLGEAAQAADVDPFAYVRNAGRVASGVFLG